MNVPMLTRHWRTVAILLISILCTAVLSGCSGTTVVERPDADSETDESTVAITPTAIGAEGAPLDLPLSMGSDGGQPPERTTEPDSVQWVRYVSEAYGLQFEYPLEASVELSETPEPGGNPSTPLATIEMLAEPLASEALRPYATATLRVDIYDNSSAWSVERWLVEIKGISSRNTGYVIEPIVTEHLQGLKVCSTAFIAPGCSIYVASDKYVYELTPFGSLGERLVSTVMIDQG